MAKSERAPAVWEDQAGVGVGPRTCRRKRWRVAARCALATQGCQTRRRSRGFRRVRPFVGMFAAFEGVGEPIPPARFARQTHLGLSTSPMVVPVEKELIKKYRGCEVAEKLQLAGRRLACVRDFVAVLTLG